MNKRKTRKCTIKSEGCEVTYIPFNSLQKCCFNPKCIMENKRRQDEKKRIKEDKRERQELREAKRSLRLNDRKWQLKKTQESFNKMRRLQEVKWYKDQGREPECISCGAQSNKPGYFCCGHYKTVGAHGELRFDEVNTELQCNRNCNMGKSGNINGDKHSHGYTRGIILKYGSEEGQARLDYLNGPHDSKKYTCEQLESMRKEFNAQIRELEKEINND